MTQIGRVRNPDVSSEWGHRPMNQGPESIDPARQQCSVLVVRHHDDTESFEAPKILCESQRHSRTAARIGSVGHGIFLEFRNESNAGIFNAPYLLGIFLRIGQQSRSE